MIAQGLSKVRVALSAAIILALLNAAYIIDVGGNPRLSLSILLGAAVGIVLQRSRFCFFCNFRDWFDTGDARGLLGILVALGVGAIGYAIVFGAWLPDPTGRLPPDAFIGPVSPALVVAGLAFGVGMTLSGSCISAHIYRLGEGSATAIFALAGSFAGFMLGLASWNPIYLAVISQGTVIWLPQHLGYAGTLLLTFALLIGIGALLTLRRGKPAPTVSGASLPTRILIERWPASLGGAMIGVIGMVAYLRVAPLGVTADVSSKARFVAADLGLLPPRLEGLDTLRGCISLVRDLGLSNNAGFVLALALAAFAAALAAGQFRPAWPTAGQAARGLAGGILLGWGATIGLGCTVGTLLSGIMAGALSGWVFGLAVFAGAALALAIGRRAGLPR
ncbi:YeeE/YedE family protein [Bradyrhizobium sp. HKCCYLR20261]|uniref:YeeE/YedE family protein n=1 Tax=Bradyrhizobium sp. HKCCYLR20261 TaxID=3420760 RepID=UPI003EC020ED